MLCCNNNILSHTKSVFVPKRTQLCEFKRNAAMLLIAKQQGVAPLALGSEAALTGETSCALRVAAFGRAPLTVVSSTLIWP